MPEGANSYTDIAGADAYLSSRGALDWAIADDDTKAAALVRACDTLNTYHYKGQVSAPGRVMAWPRKQMVYADGSPAPMDAIPAQVINAQIELAGNIITDSADPLAPVDKSQGAVTSEKVDVISVSYATPETNAYKGLTGFPAVDALLRGFLSGNGGRFGVVEVGRG
jgi:hypothetical protein